MNYLSILLLASFCISCQTSNKTFSSDNNSQDPLTMELEQSKQKFEYHCREWAHWRESPFLPAASIGVSVPISRDLSGISVMSEVDCR